VSFLSTTIIINEVLPNPSLGSEWVEIRYLGENTINPNDYLNFTISDEKRVIYSFEGDELWSNNFLVIELTGLNNDKDSVILKNAEEIIVDEMSYSNTEKDLSWSRTNPHESIFVLGEVSPLFENPIATLTIVPSLIPSPSSTPNPTSSSTPTLDEPSPNINNLTISSIDKTNKK